jgi:ubiquinone/menaquinone biosynthesis C-methylase UbiE
VSAVTTHRRHAYNVTGATYAADRYGTAHMSAYLARRHHALLDLVQRTRPSPVLEIGCGPGLSLDHLARHTAHPLHGLDLSETMIGQARARLGDRAVLSVGDALHTGYPDDTFGVVYTTRFIHQFDHYTKRLLWQEAMRVTRPGGTVVMEFYARPYHFLRYFTPARKGRSASAYFAHYPTRREVGSIVGQPFEVVPLRWAGERIRAPRLLLDEYFVVAQKH